MAAFHYCEHFWLASTPISQKNIRFISEKYLILTSWWCIDSNTCKNNEALLGCSSYMNYLFDRQCTRYCFWLLLQLKVTITANALQSAVKRTYTMTTSISTHLSLFKLNTCCLLRIFTDELLHQPPFIVLITYWFKQKRQ